MMGLAVAITGIPGGDLTATENATNLRVLRFSSDSSLGTLYTRHPNPNRLGNFSYGRKRLRVTKKAGWQLYLFHEDQREDNDPPDAARSCGTCL